MASECEISEEEVNEMNSVMQNCVVTDVVTLVEGMLQEIKSVTLNIAITGESGSGKSSFINAFLGLSDDDPGSAQTSVTETTNEAKAFSHPTVSNVFLWDLPGIGTPSFCSNTYLGDVGLLKYDLFIIVTADRFQECHSTLVKEIIQAQKKFYFIRNKVDQALEASAMRRGTPENEVLHHLRTDCEKSLTNEQVTPRVFLLSCFHPQRYDFPELQMTLLNELEGHKQHALLLSLPNFSAPLVQRKRKALANDVWKKAIVASFSSVTSAATPNPVVQKLMETLTYYQQTLCIDATSLKRLADVTGKTFKELQSEVTSTFGKGLSAETVENLLGQLAMGHKHLANCLEKKFPVLGCVIAGGITFVASYLLLQSALKDLSEDGERVIKKCLIT